MKKLFVYFFIILFNKIMTIKEIRIDMRELSKDKEFMDMTIRDAQINHKFNLVLPYTGEWFSLMKELFYNKLGDNSVVMNQLTVVLPKNVTIGKNVIIMNGALLMAEGGITIMDKVMIAADVKLITNYHDPYERNVLICKPILIKEGTWIGAGSTILPGVVIGKYAIIGADSLVNKDVPDYAVVVGNLAKIIKYLEPEKLKKSN